MLRIRARRPASARPASPFVMGYAPDLRGVVSELAHACTQTHFVAGPLLGAGGLPCVRPGCSAPAAERQALRRHPSRAHASALHELPSDGRFAAAGHRRARALSAGDARPEGQRRRRACSARPAIRPPTTAASGVPGAPNWHLAPASMALGKLSQGELCRAMLDKSTQRQQGRAAIVHHLTRTNWSRGAGRPASMPTARRASRCRLRRRSSIASCSAWAKLGAQCPQ